MKHLNRTEFKLPTYQNKIIQFGEGNFLRAFVDWQIDILNEHTDLNAGITIVRPVPSKLPFLSTQDYLYTVKIRGLNENGNQIDVNRIISSINNELDINDNWAEFLQLATNDDFEFIFSNTTEAGIEFKEDDTSDIPQTFPGKLTKLLQARFEHSQKPFVLFPCELIDYNGETLQKTVNQYIDLWQLPTAFKTWVNEQNIFCNTLVDRIVSGFTKDANLTYQDNFVDVAEYFYLFVIQAGDDIKQRLRMDKYPLNVIFTDDITPYKQRKVAILNGTHTALTGIALLKHIAFVKDALQNQHIANFAKKLIASEIIPTLDLPKNELEDFAKATISRFENPFLEHAWQSISLNSVSKFKSRNLPTLLKFYAKFNQLPKLTVFAWANLIYLHQTHNIKDDKTTVFKQPLHNILTDSFWEEDLSKIKGLEELLQKDIHLIAVSGPRLALAEVLNESH
jgi:tagaturonate reductase